MSVFEWQCQHQHFLDYLHRLNFALILFALGLGGFSGWVLDRTATSSIAASHIFVGGQLLLTEVRDCNRSRYVARAFHDTIGPRRSLCCASRALACTLRYGSRAMWPSLF